MTLSVLKSPFFFLACLLFPALLSASNINATADFEFYSEKISIEYDSELLNPKKSIVGTADWKLKKFYKDAVENSATDLAKQLLAEKERLQLNDWLYCRLVRSAVDRLFFEKKELHKALAWWVLLCESGYDIRLSHFNMSYIFLYAPSEEVLMGVPSFREDGKRFFNLTSAIYKVNTFGQVLNKASYVPNKNGNLFNYNLNELPKLNPEPVSKKVAFHYNDSLLQLNVMVDATIEEVLSDYPVINDMAYLETPLSSTLSSSLIPELEKITKEKSTKDALEVLVAFTRSAFEYKWDWNVYDEDRPMFAEQVFNSEFSDHEDRCALFYNLVKEMLDLPMLVVSHYNNNMTIGVSIDEEMKRSFDFEGEQFLICDPTHPRSKSTVGLFPNGLTKKTARVLGRYK